MGGHSADHRDIERLNSIARTAYADMRLNEQVPIAVVGSGLSVPYGGISWSEATRQGLVEALRQIEMAQSGFGEPPYNSSESQKMARITRAKRSIKAFQQKSDDGSDELYLAMQVARDGIETAHACVAEEDRHKLGDDFQDFMAKLFGTERFRLARQMQERIGLKGEEIFKRSLFETTDEEFDSILGRFYSFEMLGRILPNDVFPNICAQLQDAYKNEVRDQAESLPPDRRSLVALFLAVRRGNDPGFDAKALWKEFEGTKDNGRSCLRPLNDPIREIHLRLGIRRFITLNYDHELERALMFDDIRAIKGGHYGFADALRDRVLHRNHDPGNGRAPSTASVSRRFSDGLTASSDIYQASAAAHLFEFALNSPEYRIQIVHQHGRADVPGSMVLTDDDLNRVYRHDKYSRTTLEQALDVILTGNPILFIGLGLTEPEITRPLRQLVGEGRAAPDDPAFAIMVFDKSKSAEGYDLDGGVNAWRRQFGLFRQYGIHLFDAGHPRHGDGAFNKKVAALEAFMKAIEPFQSSSSTIETATSIDDLALLKKSIKTCQEVHVAEDIELDHIAFEWLLVGIDKGTIIISPDNYNLFVDYLRYLVSKHYTQHLIYEIRRLGEYVQNRFVETTYQKLETFGRAVDDADVREMNALEFRPKSVRHAVQTAVAGRSAHTQTSAAAIEILDSIKRPGATFLVGEMGAGKGTTLNSVLQHLSSIESEKFCFINCSMALEFDSAIFQILRFANGVAFPGEIVPPLKDRLNALQTALMTRLPTNGHPPLIVISGIERLLDAQSKALTPELELVTKMLLHPQVLKRGWHVLISGTQSVISWAENLSTMALKGDRTEKGNKFRSPRKVFLCEQYGGLLVQISDYALKNARSTGLKARIGSWTLFPQTPYVPNGARSPASFMLIGMVLENWHEIIPLVNEDLGKTRAHAELDRQILQNLAYVGQPIARSVFAHMPDISHAAQNTDGDAEDAIAKSCARLIAAGMAMDIVPFPLEPNDGSRGVGQRLALPRAVLAELRERFGVRSGEEQLSNSFTLTLAASMPTDLVLPNEDVSQTLAETVGHLHAAWKDCTLVEAAQIKIAYLRTVFGRSDLELAPLLAETAAQVERVDRIERLALMAAAPMDEALRAAAAIVRGFFSAATLVSTDPSSSPRENGGGAQFELHRKRVDRLLERTREVRRLSDRMESEFDALGVADPGLNDCREELIGKHDLKKRSPSLYSGELIWLLNEAGVIALLQGNLKAAERSFRETENALGRFKGMGALHTWRRLAINQAFIGIERGRIAEARAKLYQLEKAIDGPRLKIGSYDVRAESDDRICKPIVTGYLGLVDALGGHFASAAKNYNDAIRDLIDSGQQRALSLFYWRLGALALSMHDRDTARHNLDLAIAEAESARQIDVVWRARLTMTELQRDADPAFVATVFREARQYADTMKVPRLQVTALRREAEWRMGRDDLTVAAALTTQAMQHATRNGMTLMRISLRTLMGSIMIRQGDESGEFLLQRAIRHADRIGYQLEVNKARNALLGIKVAAQH